MFTKLTAGLVAVSAWAACVETDPDLSTVVGATGPSGVYDIEPQGRWLLGSQLDVPPFSALSSGGAFFSIDRATKDGRPVTLTVMGDAALKSGLHVGADPWFDGVIVSNGSLELRLSSPSGTLLETHFKLWRRSPAGKFDVDACGPDGVDAIPLAGVFLADGLHVAEPGRITLACGDAVGQKCNRWGYPAGPVPGPRWDSHQACTRMARADYGANGQTHTRMETAIKIADAVPGVNDLPVSSMFGDVTVWPPDPAKFFFEAAWWPGQHKAGCLSHVRWQSLPIGGYPGLDLPDPRRDPEAKDCEDMILDEIITNGAVLFNASAYNDLAIQTWHAATAGGADYVTTVRGYYAELADRLRRPFPEYHVYEYDNTVGFLLRRVPGSLLEEPDAVTPVYMYRESAYNRMVIARANESRLSAGYAQDLEREGLVFTSPRAGTVPFKLYYNENTGDYLSTVDGREPAGYAQVDTIGWITGPE